MPNIPSANTCASTMTIAEKAADMIRGGAPLPPEMPATAAPALAESRAEPVG